MRELRQRKETGPFLGELPGRENRGEGRGSEELPLIIGSLTIMANAHTTLCAGHGSVNPHNLRRWALLLFLSPHFTDEENRVLWSA